jgi:hypothetical protein
MHEAQHTLIFILNHGPLENNAKMEQVDITTSARTKNRNASLINSYQFRISLKQLKGGPKMICMYMKVCTEDHMK